MPEVGGLADTLDIMLGRAGSRPRRGGEAVAFEPPDAAVRRRYQLRWVLLCDRILLQGEMLHMLEEPGGHHAVQCATESGGDSRPVPGILGRNRIFQVTVVPSPWGRSNSSP